MPSLSQLILFLNSFFFLILIFFQKEKVKDPFLTQSSPPSFLEILTWGSFIIEFFCILIQTKQNFF